MGIQSESNTQFITTGFYKLLSVLRDESKQLKVYLALNTDRSKLGCELMYALCEDARRRYLLQFDW